MSSINISLVDNKTVLIVGTDAIPTRKNMKLSIYLSAISNGIIEADSNSIKIVFNSTDYHLIAVELNELLEFFDKNSIDYNYDTGISSLLNKQESFEVEQNNTLQLLKSIKDNDSNDIDGFVEFCESCDKDLCIRLRDYQYKSSYLLSMGNGGFDFSVPGAGKTIITYATYSFLKKDKVDRLLVIGPGSAFNAWYDEFFTCFGVEPEFENLSVESTSSCKMYFNSSSSYQKEITFINIEKIRLLTTDISTFLSNNRVLLIIDEAHKIKNPGAAATMSALEFSKYATSRIILTGTPMPNGYEDLYSLTKIFSPFSDILPYSYNQLRLMTTNGTTEIESNRIHDSLNPYYSRISKKYLIERGELLPATIEYVNCKMEDAQYELYERLCSFAGKLSDSIDEDYLMSLKKAVLIRKMQISANPALLQKSIISSMDELKKEYSEAANDVTSDISLLSKADKEISQSFAESQLIKTINKYANHTLESSKNIKAVELAKNLVSKGNKVLIWDVFVNNMDILKTMLEASINSRIELIYGGISSIERQEAIKRFREGSSMIMLANPATLAESISLHKVCQHAIYVNRNFNAAQFIQSKDRIHRINMPTGTTAHYYFIENDDTVDIAIDERLLMKETRMLKVLDAEDIEIGGSEFENSGIMSNDDINSTFMG